MKTKLCKIGIFIEGYNKKKQQPEYQLDRIENAVGDLFVMKCGSVAFAKIPYLISKKEWEKREEDWMNSTNIFSDFDRLHRWLPGEKGRYVPIECDDGFIDTNYGLYEGDEAVKKIILMGGIDLKVSFDKKTRWFETRFPGECLAKNWKRVDFPKYKIGEIVRYGKQTTLVSGASRTKRDYPWIMGKTWFYSLMPIDVHSKAWGCKQELAGQGYYYDPLEHYNSIPEFRLKKVGWLTKKRTLDYVKKVLPERG